MSNAPGTVPAGSPGEKGDASSVSSAGCGVVEPALLEEYSCSGQVVKLVWCRGLRYYFCILLKENDCPSAIEVSLTGLCPGLTVNHTHSLSLRAQRD